jgi:sn-glycerol 3-phosphate transport system permease protein
MSANSIVEDTRRIDIAANAILAFGILITLLPLYLIFTTASSSIDEISQGMRWVPSSHLAENLAWIWTNTEVPAQLLNSLLVASLAAIGGTSFAFMTAVALVYFDSRFKSLIFAAVMATLMLPLEVRIVPTYAVAADLMSPIREGLHALLGSAVSDRIPRINLVNTYSGLVIPLMCSATGTFMFRQFLLGMPPSLIEAARMDGAGPIRFMRDILLPLSAPTFVALGTVLFLGAWNQYLWPMLLMTDSRHVTAVVGLTRFFSTGDSGEIPRYDLQMAASLIALAPPLLVVAVLQRWMVRGLTLSEK